MNHDDYERPMDPPDQFDGRPDIRAKNDLVVARTMLAIPGSVARANANARLIAAAPELLRELDTAWRLLRDITTVAAFDNMPEGLREDIDSHWSSAMKIVKRARGES